MIRPALAVAGCLAACGGTPVRPPVTPAPDTPHGDFADDTVKPGYGKAELDPALASERGKLAAIEQQIASLEAVPTTGDQLRSALGDLAVRRRFIATLEACASTGRDCPPRLDEPAWTYDPETDSKVPLDTMVRFDLEDWQKVAGELYGRACACRTLVCIDSVDRAIGQLETQPTRDVQDDDTAALAIVHARECLARLRGRRPIARPDPGD
jgi:hypothetical protein